MIEDGRVDTLRETTLEHCPYLKATLRNRTGFDRIDQKAEVTKYSKLLDLAIEERFGSTWHADLVVPHQIGMNSLGILNPNLSELTRRSLSTRLFKYGFELGDVDFPEIIITEILASVKKDGFLHPYLGRREHGFKLAIQTSRAIINDGIEKRQHPLIPLRADVPTAIQEGLMYVDLSLPKSNRLF